MPLVSVIIPTHNRPGMLAEALASVRAQTFTDYEIIVVSNGESEEMRPRSHAAAARHGARYFCLPIGNLSIARNFGIGEANGAWIAFLDDDDIWLPAKLERQIVAARQTGASIITCDFVQFFPDGNERTWRPRLQDGWTHIRALNHQVWGSLPSTTIVRRDVLAEAGDFDPRLRSNEDNDMWRRISWRHRIHQMHEVLVRYRCGHPSLMTKLTKHRWGQPLQQIEYYFKIRRDTPDHLRDTVPSLKTFILPRLIFILPEWLVRPHPRLRPRTRLKQLRVWLKLGA